MDPNETTSHKVLLGNETLKVANNNMPNPTIPMTVANFWLRLKLFGGCPVRAILLSRVFICISG
jgi:kynurenine formamidase